MTAHLPILTPARLAVLSLLLVAGCASRPTRASLPSPPALRPMPAELEQQAAPGPTKPLSVSTPIETICATPAGKAVLDRDLPGLTGRPEFDMFKAMSLKQLQPMSRGHITDADLAKVQADLAALAPSGRAN